MTSPIDSLGGYSAVSSTDSLGKSLYREQTRTGTMDSKQNTLENDTPFESIRRDTKISKIIINFSDLSHVSAL